TVPPEPTAPPAIPGVGPDDTRCEIAKGPRTVKLRTVRAEAVTDPSEELPLTFSEPLTFRNFWALMPPCTVADPPTCRLCPMVTTPNVLEPLELMFCKETGPLAFKWP